MAFNKIHAHNKHNDVTFSFNAKYVDVKTKHNSGQERNIHFFVNQNHQDKAIPDQTSMVTT